MTRPREWVPLFAVVLAGGCASFYDKLTPSGVPCRDMPIIPFGKDEKLAGRPFTRLKPVSSSLKCETHGERMESIRREACEVGADAVVETAQDEVVQSTRKTIRIEGIAVKFTRPPTKP